MKNFARLAFALFGLLVHSTNGRSQEFATGPYADEAAYLRALNDASVTISGSDLAGVASSVELVIDDQVSDSCWTNTSAVAARVRAELEKFGVAVFQEDLAFNTSYSPLISIVGLGYRLPSNVCFASVELTVNYWVSDDLGSLAYTGVVYRQQSWGTIWSAHSIFTNGRNVDDQVLDQVQEWVDTYIADIARARRVPAVQDAYERWKSTDPMTQVEFDAMIASFAENAQ